MLHKIFKQSRRAWLVIAEDTESFEEERCDPIIAGWAREYASALIKEVQRLRTELKSRNKKKRAVHAKLAAEQNDHDDLLTDIEKFQVWVNSYDIMSKDVLSKRLDEILKPYREDDHD